MNQIQFIFEFLSTVTKCDNDVLFRKMDDCVQAPQCAVSGRSGGGSFFISRLGEMWLWQAGARPQWCWPYSGHQLNGAELHNGDTIAILQIHSKIQYLQLSPTAQPSTPPAASRASWYIFEPPTKSAAKWYFVILWHFCCCIVIVASGGCTPSNKSHTFALLLLMWKTKKKWGFFSIKILHRSSRSQIL